MVKMILIGISIFSSGVVTGILVLYFFGLKRFLKFMKIDRMNLQSEIESNSGEIRGEIDRKAFESIQSQNLIEEKEETFNGNGEWFT